ncbi:NAD(P)-binding domain-containing protein, partial [Nocardia brasiliensis]|uniref:NAD(P)-binding domain-containing protein n=1 Tax=Nocardia brasiliensis TaxID=37326 RepID=UPI0024549A62
MTTLGLIGSGNIGATVARLAIAAGLDVVLSNSRGPETLTDLVAELGPRARAANRPPGGPRGGQRCGSRPQPKKKHMAGTTPAGGRLPSSTSQESSYAYIAIFGYVVVLSSNGRAAGHDHKSAGIG